MICREPKHRILIVDDNVDAGELLRMMLELQGYEVRLSFDGPTAVSEARRFRPQVVFTDIVMPGMSGFELAATIRREGAGSGALLIAISGYTGNYADSEKDISCFDAFLTKPVAYAEICALLAAHFEQAMLPGS